MRDWNSGFCNSGQALRAEWHEGGGERLGQKNSSLKSAATNGSKWIAFVLYEDMNQSKINLPSVNSSPLHTAPTQYQCIQHYPITNAHSIHLNSMLIAADSLLVGFSILKTFILRSMPLTCHSTRSRRRSRRIHQHRGIKYYLDSPLRKKTRLRVSITPPKIDKILERTVLL